MSGFHHVSMLIDLDCEPWTLGLSAYTHTASNLTRRSRALVHESIHYWQQLSHGYLLRLGEEDWTRMVEWERTGGPAAFGPHRAHYTQKEGSHGFTAFLISECFARFWEVLLAGPEAVLRDALLELPKHRLSSPHADRVPAQLSDDAFDRAMQASGEYSLPYTVARRILDPIAGLVIFPFLAHFALKTSRPAYFLERFIDEVAPAAAEEARAIGLFDLPRRVNPEDLYPFVENCCTESVRRDGEPGLLHSVEIFRNSPLRANFVYRWSFRRLRQASPATFDCALCIQGPERAWLATRFTPPSVRFRDGSSVPLCQSYLERADGLACLTTLRAREAMRASLAIQERWVRFLAAIK
jgi:hypothetical protein